jgi:hypothetical protein
MLTIFQFFAMDAEYSFEPRSKLSFFPESFMVRCEERL